MRFGHSSAGPGIRWTQGNAKQPSVQKIRRRKWTAIRIATIFSEQSGRACSKAAGIWAVKHDPLKWQAPWKPISATKHPGRIGLRGKASFEDTFQFRGRIPGRRQKSANAQGICPSGENMLRSAADLKQILNLKPLKG